MMWSYIRFPFVPHSFIRLSLIIIGMTWELVVWFSSFYSCFHYNDKEVKREWKHEWKKEEQSTNPWLAVGGSFPCCFFVLVCFIFIKLQVKWKKWNGTREFNEKKHKPKNKDNRGTNHSLCCRTKSAKKWNHASVPLLYTSLYFIPLGFYLQQNDWFVLFYLMSQSCAFHNSSFFALSKSIIYYLVRIVGCSLCKS